MKTAEERKKMCVSVQSIRNLWEQHGKNAEKMDEIDTVNRHFLVIRGGKKRGGIRVKTLRLCLSSFEFHVEASRSLFHN